jgi:hypothetical protein
MGELYEWQRKPIPSTVFFFGFLTMRIILTSYVVVWLLLMENGSSIYEKR